MTPADSSNGFITIIPDNQIADTCNSKLQNPIWEKADLGMKTWIEARKNLSCPKKGVPTKDTISTTSVQCAGRENGENKNGKTIITDESRNIPVIWTKEYYAKLSAKEKLDADNKNDNFKDESFESKDDGQEEPVPSTASVQCAGWEKEQEPIILKPKFQFNRGCKSI